MGCDGINALFTVQLTACLEKTRRSRHECTVQLRAGIVMLTQAPRQEKLTLAEREEKRETEVSVSAVID